MSEQTPEVVAVATEAVKPVKKAAVRKTTPVDVAVASNTAPVAAVPVVEEAVSPAPVAEVAAVAEVEPLADAGKAKKAAKPVKAKVSKSVKAEPVSKPEKIEKPRKTRLVRDSYAMPEAEYARIGELKKRLGQLGTEVKKSELLRCGIAVLAALNDAELSAVVARVERVKTGRPAKK